MRKHLGSVLLFPLLELVVSQSFLRTWSQVRPSMKIQSREGLSVKRWFPMTSSRVLIFILDKVSKLLRCNRWAHLLIHFHERKEGRYPRHRIILVDCVNECLRTLLLEIFQVLIVPCRLFFARPKVWWKNELGFFRLILDDLVELWCFRCLWFH